MWRICALGLLASALWALALTQRATAQVVPPLTVTRGPGAESCPDLDRLARMVVQLGNHDKFPSSSSYTVTFSRTPDVFQASIRSSGGGSERVLEDSGTDCRALEQATAITLALLSDSDAHEASSRPAEAPIAPVNPTTEPANASALSDSAARADDGPKAVRAAGLTWIFSAGGAGLFGIVRPVAPAVGGEVGVSFGRVRTHLGALGMLPQTLRLGPGTLHESLLSGVARGCVAAARGASVRFDLCPGIYFGRTWTEARGYTRNSSASKVWLTIPIELSLVHAARHYWGELGVAALIPLRRADFAIDGLGPAYRSPPIGAQVSLRLAYTTGR